MKKQFEVGKVTLEIDFTEWALPLEIWWIKGVFCVEILCFSVEFVAL